MYNGRAMLSCSMNLFPTENYFTAATKRLEEREKILERLICIQGILIKFYPTRKLSRCMQILLQTTPDNLTSFILCFSPLLGNMRTPSRKYINIHNYI